MEVPVYYIWRRRRDFPLVRVLFPPALDDDHKPILRHDPAHHLLGDDGSLAADQGVYPAIPITPVVFVEKGGDPFMYAGILVLFFEDSLLIIITAFWQFKLF